MKKQIRDGYCQCGCGEKTSISVNNQKQRGWIKGTPVKFISGHNSKGKNNSSWKGTKASHLAIHKWVERHYGKAKECEDCGIETLPQRHYHWANISGKYKRDIKDFKRLCAKCHKKFDSHLLARGERNGSSKLTNMQVLEIRKLYSPNKYNICKLSKMFNVSFGNIFCIIKRKTWAHV